MRIEPVIWADLGFIKTTEDEPHEGPADTPSSPNDDLLLFIEAVWTPLLRVPNTDWSIMDYCDFSPIKNYPWLGDFTRCDPMAMMLSLTFAKNMATVGLLHAVHSAILPSNDTTDVLAVGLKAMLGVEIEGTIQAMSGGMGFNRSWAKSPPQGFNIAFETHRFR